MSIPSKKTIERLNTLFAALWSNREGVKGSWGADSHGYHPTYIHRGPLLFVGERTVKNLYVLPTGCEVTPVAGNSRASCNTMPKLSMEPIQIYNLDDGPWWDLVDQELDLMEAEMEFSQEQARVFKEAERAAAIQAEHDRLEAARAAIQTFIKVA